MTSRDSISFAFLSCSRCSARRDSQLNASEPQNNIRSGSEVFAVILDEKHRCGTTATLSFGADIRRQKGRTMMVVIIISYLMNIQREEKSIRQKIGLYCEAMSR